MNDLDPQTSLRLFIAIALPPAVLDLQVESQKKLAQAGLAARWVKPQSMHLTLKFMGATPARHLDAIRSAMHSAAASTPEFTLATQHLGVFPSLRRAGVIWSGLHGRVDILKDLQHRLDRALTATGLESDRRSFHPHLTLGRFKKSPAPQTLAAAIKTADAAPSPAFSVDRIWLIQSELTRRGAVYTHLHAAVLGKS